MLSGRVRPKIREAAKKGALARQVPIWRYLEILVEAAEADQEGTEHVAPVQTEQLDLVMSA
jgi:hypothetical protein